MLTQYWQNEYNRLVELSTLTDAVMRIGIDEYGVFYALTTEPQDDACDDVRYVANSNEFAEVATKFTLQYEENNMC